MTLVRCSHVCMITHTHLCVRTKRNILGNIPSFAASLNLTLLGVGILLLSVATWVGHVACRPRDGSLELAVSILSKRPLFGPRSVHGSFVVDRVTPGQVFLPVLQFSPVSIIPPTLHTHSFIYHRRCIIFFSQCFSFPLSVSFHQRSIRIHSSTTDAV
jgi:hypothetical protein